MKVGNMVFAGEIPLGPGSRFAWRRVVRLTFFPMGPDKVRQFSADLTGMALDLGFSSHSHFTETFRRAFGRTPSSVRRAF